MQPCASICILLAEKQPKPLMMQASVLGRALFDNLASVLALTVRQHRLDDVSTTIVFRRRLTDGRPSLTEDVHETMIENV